jgi:hypothetical protein
MGKLQNNPSSIGWVHPKSTHARPLPWGNKNCKRNKTETFYILAGVMGMKSGCPYYVPWPNLQRSLNCA